MAADTDPRVERLDELIDSLRDAEYRNGMHRTASKAAIASVCAEALKSYLTTLLAKVPQASDQSPYYVGGPWLDGSYGLCEVATGRVFSKVPSAPVEAVPRFLQQALQDRPHREVGVSRGIKLSTGKTENEIDRLETEVARLTAELQEVRKDADRYRWLREQAWFAGPLCVLRDPKDILTRGAFLGADCPSLSRLDDAIDAAMTKKKP